MPPRKRPDKKILPLDEQGPLPIAPFPTGEAPPQIEPDYVPPEADWQTGPTPAQERRRQAALYELARRRAEALVLYQPLPSQAAFHADRRKIRLARGSNRAGKTLAAAIETAMATTGRDPYDKWPKANGRAVLVGKDGRHVGQVMYRKLFRAGAFKMVRDSATGLWRALRPGEPSLGARLAPPLIPPRMVDWKGVAWENKRESIPSLVPLKNGWELNFFSSLGAPPQGWDVDLCLAGWSQVYDPVQGQYRRIDEIDGPWHVLSFNTRTQKVETRPATRPFIKGYGELCRITLANGQQIFSTRKHHILTAEGDWTSVQIAWKNDIPISSLDHLHGADSSVLLTNIEAVGQGPIYDMGVEGTHNYLYGGTVSHNCWLDEEIVHASWVPEIMARLLDRSGKMIWSATPQAATEHLFALHERAAADDPEVGEHFMGLIDNPYIADSEKLSFAANLSDDEHRVRFLGEFAITGYKVYPEFDMRLHGCDAFEVPGNWTRYLVIDPGRQVCAVLFAAVDPGSDHVWLYDELYLRNCTAAIFGERVGARIGDIAFEAFIIDHSGGRITDMGSGRTVEEQYSEELTKRKIHSVRSGTGFFWGSDDVTGGIEASRALLRVGSSGKPKLQVFRGRLPNFEHEIKYFHYRRKDGILTDEIVRKNDHLMADFRYLAAFGPKYVKAAKKRGGKNYVLDYLEAKKRRARKESGEGYVRLGPQGGSP